MKMQVSNKMYNICTSIFYKNASGWVSMKSPPRSGANQICELDTLTSMLEILPKKTICHT